MEAPRCEVGQCVRARSPGLLFKFAAPCASVSFFCPRISKDVPNRLQDLQRSGVAISFGFTFCHTQKLSQRFALHIGGLQGALEDSPSKRVR